MEEIISFYLEILHTKAHLGPCQTIYNGAFCKNSTQPLSKKCPYLELFWSVFFHVWTEYGEILHISPYSVQMWEKTDENNSEYGQLLCPRLKNTFAKSSFRDV